MGNTIDTASNTKNILLAILLGALLAVLLRE